MKNKNDKNTENESVDDKSKPAQESNNVTPTEKKQEPVKNWSSHVEKKEIPMAIAKGACVLFKKDWDAEISDKEFEKAIESFSKRPLGARRK